MLFVLQTVNTRDMVAIRDTYVFQAVQVLVPLAADVTFIWLLLLHPEGTRIWGGCLRIDNGERPISILVQLLRLMTVRLVIPRSMSVTDTS